MCSLGRFLGEEEAIALTIEGRAKKDIYPTIFRWRCEDEKFDLEMPEGTEACSDRFYSHLNVTRHDTLVTTMDDSKLDFQLPIKLLTQRKVYAVNRKFINFNKARLSLKDVNHPTNHSNGHVHVTKINPA
jgi:hypothetical protein